MELMRTVTLYCMLALLGMSLTGCGGGADEDKPLADVKAEAETMSVEKLKAKAMEYKDAIMAKQKDVEKVMEKLEDVPVMEAMGEQAKGLKADIDSLNKSISNLKDRFTVYYNKLKEKGGDTSGLEL